MQSARSTALLWYGGSIVAVACAVFAVTAAPLYAAVAIAGAAFLLCALTPGISLYVIFALAFFLPVTISVGLPGLMLTYVFGAILALCVAGRVVRFVRSEQPPSVSAGYLLLLLPILGAGVVHQVGPAALEASSRALIVLIVLLWHVSAEAKLSPDRIRRVAMMIVWAAPPLLVLALYQRAVGYWPVLDELAISPSYKSTGDASRSAGIMGHPILYGAYCMVAAAIALFVAKKRRGLLFTCALIGVVLSGSRSAWLAFAVILAYYAISRGFRVTPKMVAGAFLAVTGVVAAAVFAPEPVSNAWATLNGRLSNLSESESALARILRNDLAWRQITFDENTFVFGLGPGALAAYFSQNTAGDNLARTFDNSYLTLWYEYGLLAVILLALLLFLGITKRGGAGAGRALLLGCAAQIALFDFYQWPLMLAAFALGVGLREKAPAEDESDELKSPASTVSIRRGRTPTASR